jgi:hypothetical protein
MKLVRGATLAVTLLLCGGGYLFSQYCFFTGATGRYSAALDSSPVPLLSLVLVLVLAVLAFLPGEEES